MYKFGYICHSLVVSLVAALNGVSIVVFIVITVLHDEDDRAIVLWLLSWISAVLFGCCPGFSAVLFGCRHGSLQRTSERAIERYSDRAMERSIARATERPSDRAIEQSSYRATERPSDRATERPTEDDYNSSSRRPFETLTSAFCIIFQN